MKIKIESTTKDAHSHSAEIETTADDLDIHEVWDELIRPLLIAYGYSQKGVDSLVAEER